MSDDQILAEIRKLRETAGKARVLSALTGRGIGATTAERIINGSYKNKPSEMLRVMLLETIAALKAA